MPAATSHEDIYQMSMSSSSSYSPYLPDYMMFMDIQSQEPLEQQQHLAEVRSSNWNCKGQRGRQTIPIHSESQRNCWRSSQQQLHYPQQSSLNTYQQRLQKPRHYSRLHCQSDLHLEPTMVLSMSLERDTHLSRDSDDDEEDDDDDEGENRRADSYLLGSSEPTSTQHYLTIEELRSARNSCWLCGCNWQQDHVSLDCPECDGYALSRPCPSCDGECKQVWERNIAGTHDRHKASWVGQCRKMQASAREEPAAQRPSCSSLPSSAASSDSESDCHHRSHHTAITNTNANNNNNNNNNNNQTEHQSKQCKSHHHLCVCN